ncbi:MAG TPA: hypothetical protein VLU47_00830 [Blastocatellia bacterium]|nr:hypothetical protein [Blastocatellia bacterium]
MTIQKRRSFIITLLAVALLGAWFSGQNQQISKAPVALAQTSGTTEGESSESPKSEVQAPLTESSNSGAAGSTFEDGYRAGYRDAQQDCSSTQAVAPSSYTPRARSAPRVRVAGVRYEAAPRKGHSTRNMILRIAAPAAIGAGIGAIAGGKRGAGAGALIGGGGGALYHLIKHRRD